VLLTYRSGGRCRTRAAMGHRERHLPSRGPRAGCGNRNERTLGCNRWRCTEASNRTNAARPPPGSGGTAGGWASS
jgi:hypothetical protein